MIANERQTPAVIERQDKKSTAEEYVCESRARIYPVTDKSEKPRHQFSN